MTDYLLSQIIKITKDETSNEFWNKAIRILGPNKVEMELGELKYQLRIGQVKHPAKYLTKLLKNQMSDTPITKSNPSRTYLEDTPQDLLRHLMPREIPLEEAGETKKMPVPYSGRNIPWPTFIGPEFFTLSTNKNKSDKVKATFRGLNSSILEAPLIRGRIKPGSKEYGIPTAQHMKVLAALELAWSQKNCDFTEYSNGTLVCYVRVSARELANLMEWKNFGGRDLKRLINLITDLKSMPYYILLEELNIKGLKGYGFYLLSDISLINKKTRGGEETIFYVSFSAPVSYQMLQKHAVVRARQLTHLRSELASLLWLYLEPNLRSHNETYINLSNLIKVLQLPKARWHKSKFERKRQFEKAVKELDGQRLADNRKMIVGIKKGLQDWQLVARLEGPAI